MKLMDHYFYIRMILGLLFGMIVISSIAYGFDLSTIAKVLFPGSVVLLLLAIWLQGRRRSSSTSNIKLAADSDSVSKEQRDSEWN